MNRHSKSNLVAIGGGSGLATLLRGLKHAVGEDLDRLTAIVTVADDGGSSGRLRRDFGVLPPGDLVRHGPAKLRGAVLAELEEARRAAPRPALRQEAS